MKSSTATDDVEQLHLIPIRVDVDSPGVPNPSIFRLDVLVAILAPGAIGCARRSQSFA
jgi:hypothetical protein